MTKPVPISKKRVPAPSAHRRADRRVLRTRDALGDALVSLMHEKPFDQITVQHVLDRAAVSRSTFYTHYRDKNDLFLSDVEDFLEFMAFRLSHSHEVSNRVAPVREFFAHVADWHEFHDVLVSAGKIRDFLDLCQGYFARAIQQRLNELEHSAPAKSRKIATIQAARAQMLAGALISLLSWWLDRGMPTTAEEMDRTFHQIVWSGANGVAAKIG
ncbi:MAG TPA: TetR/AcrR family transcriptional regulator [Terriglobales bacterium]